MEAVLTTCAETVQDIICMTQIAMVATAIARAPGLAEGLALRGCFARCIRALIDIILAPQCYRRRTANG